MNPSSMNKSSFSTSSPPNKQEEGASTRDQCQSKLGLGVVRNVSRDISALERRQCQTSDSSVYKEHKTLGDGFCLFRAYWAIKTKDLCWLKDKTAEEMYSAMKTDAVFFKKLCDLVYDVLNNACEMAEFTPPPKKRSKTNRLPFIKKSLQEKMPKDTVSNFIDEFYQNENFQLYIPATLQNIMKKRGFVIDKYMAENICNAWYEGMISMANEFNDGTWKFNHVNHIHYQLATNSDFFISRNKRLPALTALSSYSSLASTSSQSAICKDDVLVSEKKNDEESHENPSVFNDQVENMPSSSSNSDPLVKSDNRLKNCLPSHHRYIRTVGIHQSKSNSVYTLHHLDTLHDTDVQLPLSETTVKNTGVFQVRFK